MATKNRINLIIDGKLAYSRSTTREYAWALVGFSKIGSGTEAKFGITNCGNDRAALERIQLKARTSSWRPRHLVLVPIVNREARITSAELEAPAAKPAATELEPEPDYGGATDCMGNVFSDADPGL